jgi:4-hydroxy-tetrahydrodipicolinate reductase
MTATPTKVRVILYGVGALGALLLDCLATGYPLIEVAGAVDVDPAKAGRRLGDVHPGTPAAAREIVVAPTLAACLAGLTEPAHLLFHMTESVLAHVEGQMTEALDAGLNVLSASEAMFHPALRYPDVAARLDAAARRRGVSISGTGINPGFSFDSLPLLLARVTSGVRAIRISRTIDVTGTGPGDIDHVGYGLWPDEFDRKIAEGRVVGHMGGPESIACLAERLGLDIDRVAERWSTSTAAFPVDSGSAALGMIEPGRVIGITQEMAGMRGGETVISLRLVMYYRPELHGLRIADDIEIEGAHHVRASLVPAALSLFGAANMIVNAAHDVVGAPPGLVNMLDLTIAGTRRGGFRYAVDPAVPPHPGEVRLVRRPV